MCNTAVFLMVYMTAADQEEARRIAETLVEERLAACVNILGPIQSVYRWKEAVESAAEVALTAKTEASCFEALAARVRSLHGYETPCIVALPLVRGDESFLSWIGENISA